jgi:5-methyltetrahydrofolate--homocysteine methyltransferase
MRCNGFEVIDLGVMVPGETIVQKAIDENADVVAVSGLITPSLEEMRHIAQIMEMHKLSIPLMVGGATTSPLHTAVKIAPEYSGPVVHTHDAAMMPIVAQQLLHNRDEFMGKWNVVRLRWVLSAKGHQTTSR